MALLPTAVSGMQTVTAQLITAKYTGGLEAVPDGNYQAGALIEFQREL